MLPHIRDEWVRRLLSGDYRQDQGRLRVDGNGGPRYCCLGVLCDMAVERGVVLYDPEKMTYRDPDDPRASYGGVLPSAVARWAGLTHVGQNGETRPDNDPSVSDEARGVVDRTLSQLNDSGWSFATIAELIRRQL